LSDDKLIKGIIDAVTQNVAYVDAVSQLVEGERATVEATVRDFVGMLTPMIQTLDELEQSEEVMVVVRARLAEKLRGR